MRDACVCVAWVPSGARGEGKDERMRGRGYERGRRNLGYNKSSEKAEDVEGGSLKLNALVLKTGNLVCFCTSVL